jgi:hypothetical protein
MVGSRIGGVNVFGGGLALYNARRKVVGALGVSGDTSCADHMIDWRLRNRLSFDSGAAGELRSLPLSNATFESARLPRDNRHGRVESK